jgi:hypothetical protein
MEIKGLKVLRHSDDSVPSLGKESRRSFRGSPEQTDTSTWVGDFVVEFASGKPLTRRAFKEEWERTVGHPTWAVWQQAPGIDWKGFPLLEVPLPGWRAWLLGNLTGHNSNENNVTSVTRILSDEQSGPLLNGHALLWAWEEAREQWHVWTNRFGTLQAYYGQHGNSAALGSCFDAVARLASARDLDWEAVSGFFGFGFFPQDRTFLRNVRILRPATHYVFDARGNEIKAERYWHWKHEPNRQRSYEDTVQQFGELFHEVMSGLLRSGPQTTNDQPPTGRRIALPISGGLDSRCTIAAIDSDRLSTLNAQSSTQLWAYSYGYSEDSVETRIARQVAATRGLPFEAFTIKPYLFDRLAHILAAVEGFQDVTQCRQAFVADELAQHADYVIAAHWGDVWLDDMGLVGGRPQDLGSVVSSQLSNSQVAEHTLSKMAKNGRAWLLENVCAPRLGKENPEGLSRDFVEAGLKPLQHIQDADFRVKAFKTDNWSFRWTLASLRMFQAAAFPRLPFYDTRLADFFCTVPSEFVAGRRLQIDYLKRFAPDLAGIKWQPYGADLFHYQDFNPLDLPKRAAGRLWRTLSGKQVIERNWEAQFGGERGEAGLKHWLLQPGLRLHEFVSKEKVQTLLDSFRAEPLKHGRGYTVSMLLTFSAWLEHQA